MVAKSESTEFRRVAHVKLRRLFVTPDTGGLESEIPSRFHFAVRAFSRDANCASPVFFQRDSRAFAGREMSSGIVQGSLLGLETDVSTSGSE